jgi:hypothetical protein
MDLREEILYNYDGKKGKELREIKNFQTFVRGMNEDIRTFGKKETIELYSIIFGDDLKESFEEGINELNEVNLEGLPAEARNALGFRQKAMGGVAKLPWLAKEIPAITKAGPLTKGAASKLSKFAIPGYTPQKALSLWEKIKNFFKGGFTSIKEIFQTGNWSKLFTLPIFKGALAAGGVAALLVILKKIFGKKKIDTQEAQIRAQAAKSGYSK